MIFKRCCTCLKDIRENLRFSYCLIHYVQGQSPETRVREYFYFVDHQGQVGVYFVFDPAIIRPHRMHRVQKCGHLLSM